MPGPEALLGAGAGGFLIALAYSDGSCDDCGIFAFIFPARFRQCRRGDRRNDQRGHGEPPRA